jgi:hypothetical protein
LLLYKDKNNHFAIRAALVLEEVRHSIAEPLALRRDPANRLKPKASAASDRDVARIPSGQHSKAALKLELINQERKDHGITSLTFEASKHFSKSKVKCLTYGMVFECTLASCDRKRDIAGSILGLIMEGDKAKMRASGRIDIIVFCPVPYAHDVPFLGALLGNALSEERSLSGSTSLEPATGSENVSLVADGKKLCPLNDTNLIRAMDSFLNSAPNSITIIQG